jgi:hypothetical protein
MKLSHVLASIGGSEKTAGLGASSASTSAASGGHDKKASAATTADKLRTALKEAQVQAPTGGEKQAAAPSPLGDLMKTAAAVAGAEHEALVKEAQLYGAAVADGFMARLSQYNEAAEKIASQRMPAAAPKTAAASTDSFEKFAAENPDLVKEAAELGFATTMGQMDKLAGAAYEKGYNEAVTTIYKFAHGSFVQGFEDVARLLQGQ